MQKARRARSSWLGYSFLGLSVVLTVLTLVMALTDRNLADFGIFSNTDEPSNHLSQAEISATMTASAVALATPTPTPPPPPDNLDLTATAVYLVDPVDDVVLYERQADVPLQPASTAKIFTAMVVLDHASPEEVIEITEEDVVDPARESTMGLQAGDRLTVHDLLVGLMLPSGNDAANALSRTIGARLASSGDESPYDRFVDEMNRLASELGLETSVLKNPAGLDREAQAVTARELAIAAEVMLERPSLRAIVAMKRADVQVGGANPRVLSLDNTNELLIHEGVHGVKTGTTDGAGQCMVVAYRNGESSLIAIILDSEDRYADTRTLLDLPTPVEEPEEDPGM